MIRCASRLPLVLVLSSLIAGVAPVRAQNPEIWLDEVDPLIMPREREVFVGLTNEADRQAFIQRFWQARDLYPDTARNEMRERWESRLQEVHRRWGDPRDDRARVYLVSGDPSSTFETRCAGAPVEVWIYEPRFQVKYRTLLVFRQAESEPAHFWRPGEAPDLATAAKGPCAAEPVMGDVSIWVRLVGREGYETIVKRFISPPRPREWVSSFKPPSAEIRRESRALPARLAVAFPGRQGEGLVRVMIEPIEIPPDVAPIPGSKGAMVVTGRVLRGAETVDTFRYRFDSLPSGLGRGQPLAFERRLRPGQYTLKVELEATDLGRSFVGEKEVAVPALGALAAPPVASPTTVSSVVSVPAASNEPDSSPGVRLFAEADAVLAAPHPSLHLLSSGGKLLAGIQRFEAQVEPAAGLPARAQIERVAFSLDGRPILTRNREPYEAQLDLGATPRPHRLVAQGLSPSGEVLASDELVLNAGAQRFAVKLREPQPGRTYRASLRAVADVQAPEDRNVERVEVYLGDARVATLYQPPYSQPLVLPAAAATGYVRAVAYLDDGTSAEDLVLLNAPGPADTMDIRMVELYTNVIDGAGRPVEGLASGDFQVLEDGTRQSLRLVERVQDAPLHLVTLIDNSASMLPRLEASRLAALQFLRRTLRPKDQAAVITFNNAPRVVVGLTGDQKILEEGLSGLIAEEQTSLYDSLIFSLDYLGGASGQRAILLLSDGADKTSTFRFADALESARRAGIAVYVIGIGLTRDESSRGLARLAAETGGRSFFLPDVAGLEQAYQMIESDLRSRYRISYQSSNTRPGDAFRTVKVEVARKGLEARTISGYYP